MENMMEVENSYIQYQTYKINISMIMTILKIGTFLALPMNHAFQIYLEGIMA